MTSEELREIMDKNSKNEPTTRETQRTGRHVKKVHSFGQSHRLTNVDNSLQAESRNGKEEWKRRTEKRNG